jgi:hypothetical protein
MSIETFERQLAVIDSIKSWLRLYLNELEVIMAENKDVKYEV